MGALCICAAAAGNRKRRYCRTRNLHFFEGSFTWELFFINAALVGLGELVVCYVLGLLLMYALERNDLYKKIFE